MQSTGCAYLSGSYNFPALLLFFFQTKTLSLEIEEEKRKKRKSEAHQKTLGYFLFHYKSDKVHESKHPCVSTLEVGN